jgi:transcriptional regulator with XRE-family HTH domain
MDIREQFGRILRDLRTAKGLTQEEVAFRAGMSVPYLSDIERGRSSPSLSMLADLALALETHPSEMLRDLKLEAGSGNRKRPKDA